ncbi:uncharacterized protein A1O9_12899 [Exophiala aquamarina CBS 119918]|uniref:Uncharacterized protein n=1 Tax=Exophiala aquamarina CBS 119918 TaxID=1182545 RepID=A0A072NT44_9EURO|nr:uncharacterized protein A1O9_12899 [Exophiala aquamarina CBS 119918]KEF51049.1 hypothetical protein A1O9_12899 [Exophiala aquamarina CBS 119918]
MEKSSRVNDSVIELTQASGSEHSNRSFNAAASTEHLPTPTWPQEPVPLVPDRKVSILMAIFDASLLLVPFVLFTKIGLVIGAWYIDRGHRGSGVDLVSKLTLFLLEFNGQMVTAFTIIFVTIMSTLVRRYALWKAQEGAYVSELEQLQGSISLPSTFKLIISLRAFTLTSVALVSVWSFYYLGSQACKREFQKVSSANFHTMAGYTGGPDYVSGFSPAFVDQEDSPLFRIEYVNSDFNYAQAWGTPTGDQSSRYGTDSAGSALLPDLNAILRTGYRTDPNSYDTHIPKADRHGWVDVSRQSLLYDGQFYSSFVGNLVYFRKRNIGGSGNHAFQTNGFLGDYTMQTSYLDVGCDVPTILPFESFPNGTYLKQSISLNMTELRDDAPRDMNSQPLREFELWLRWPVVDYNQIPTPGSSRQICNISTVNVEIKIHCQDQGCYPRQMRYANHTSRQNATSYSTPFDDDVFAGNFFTNILLANGVQTDLIQPTTIGWNIGSGLQASLGSTTYSTPYDADEANLFNTTITRYFNSYYMVSQQETGVNPIYGGAGFLEVSVDGAFYDPHYAVSWPWIAVDIVSCLILFVASVIACSLRVKTLAPDIFGYVSSLTRDNQYLQVPDNGTTLSGIQRARLLKGVKVKIGDVSAPHEQVGRVGLAQVGSGVPVQVANLQPTTTYL